MKKLMELMAEELASAFEKAGYNPEYGKVTVSNRPDLCEFQCNGAMAGAKAYKKAPFMIADDVVEHLKDSQIFAMAEVVKPGFINLQVKEEFLADYLKKMAADEKYSVKTAEKPKTIIIDYGGPNVAKPLHVGHLRSAIIGESIKRIGRFVGHKVIGDVHLGDWGLQMGLIITELKHRKPELVYFDDTYEGEYPKEAPSANWRKSIHVQVVNPKKTKNTVMKLLKQHISFSRVNLDIWLSGITSCRFLLQTSRETMQT
jgi:arginyl-tRNA synthetase